VWKIVTLVIGLCCVGFINDIGVIGGVRRERDRQTVAVSILPN
jgi:hypothetical protein